MHNAKRKAGKHFIITGTLLLIALLVLGGIYWLVQGPKEGQITETDTLELGGTDLVVEIADTPAERQRGLSGRSNLGPNIGMLFVFEQPRYHRFWMKDMNFAIDIIWLDESFKVVDISPQLSPDTYPQTFASETPAKYALEVNAGFAAAHDINVGDQARSNLGRQ